MRDVARMAGVSVATVSRALAHPDLVSPKKLSAVKAAVQKLNYVVQGVGRALSSRRTNMIGAIVPTLDHALWATTIVALQNAVTARGYSLAVACNQSNAAMEVTLARRLLESGVDGIVLCGKVHDPELLRLLENVGVPCVLTWAFGASTTRTCIGFDNRKAAHLVVEHLVALGHRHLGIVAGTRESEWQRERTIYLRREVEKYGLTMGPDSIVEGPVSFQTGRIGIQTLLLHKRRRPSAVMCGNDVIAMGAIAMSHEMGIAIPNDLSLTGFADLDIAPNVIPPLTTVRFPAEELGARAGEEIVKQIASGTTRAQIELPISLVVRSTTAAPRRRTLST